MQGQRVLQDFNIAAEAGGNGKATIKTFTASVSDGTLEIRLFWAGKGTVSIPTKGDYGPLISAISVTPSTQALFSILAVDVNRDLKISHKPSQSYILKSQLDI